MNQAALLLIGDKQTEARQTDNNNNIVTTTNAITTTTTTTLSYPAASNKMPQKKQISKQEYCLREEWAPETVHDYQISSGEPAQNQHEQLINPPQPQDLKESQADNYLNPHFQVHMPSKHSQPLSSSLFEEWKAKALRGPYKEKTEEPDALSAAASKTNKNKNRFEGSFVSGDVRVLLGEHSDQTVSIRARTKKPSLSITAASVAASGAYNNINEEDATSSDATRLPGHTAEAANAQIEAEESGAILAAGSKDNGNKHADSITAGHPKESPFKDNNKNEGALTTSDTPRRPRGKPFGKASVREKSREPGFRSAAAPKKGRDDKGNTASARHREMLKECSNHETNVGTKTRQIDNDREQQSEAYRESNAKEESLAFARSANNTASPVVNRETNTTTEAPRRGRTSQTQRCEWERQYSRGRQRSLERDSHFRARSLDRTPYTTPSGILLGVDDLRKLALGTMFKSKDKVYFIPSFIEDPWKGLEPVPSIRPSDLMDRF